MGTRTAPMATGSDWQLATANTICAARRHRKAKAARWSRFETKIAASAIMVPLKHWFGGFQGKDGAAGGMPG